MKLFRMAEIFICEEKYERQIFSGYGRINSPTANNLKP